MNRPSTSTPRFIRKKRRDTLLARSVHATLSKRQRAYSVFLPAPYNYFPLFQAIFVLPNQADRSNSPRSTLVNLKSTFERLRNNHHIHHGEDQSVIDAFINEFNNTALEQPQLPPEYHAVSEESLSNAGVEFSSPTGLHLGISASRTRITSRQIRLQHRFSQAYKGGSQLQTLVWTYAQPVLRLILKELHGNDNFPSAPGERALLAIVTRRIVSTVGVSKTAETVTSAGASAGDGTGTFKARAGGETRTRTQEDYQDLYGVTGLHFIAFPIECIEEDKWRIYRGISVCDSDINDDDDSFTQDTRNRDSFYRAQKWVFGEAELMHGSDSTTIHKSHPTQMSIFVPPAEMQPDLQPGLFRANANNEDDKDMQGSLPFVDVSQMSVSAPWVEVEITPVLNEFAQKQRTLASYHSKTALGDSQKLKYAAHLLRSALGEHCFESPVSAIFNISRCSLAQIGTHWDLGVAEVLKYCASGLRRNYDSRAIWLSLLAREVACYPQFPVERRIISLMFFARRTLTSLVLNVDQSRLGGSITGISWDSDIWKKEDDKGHPQMLLRPDQRKQRMDTSLIPDSTAKQASTPPLPYPFKGTLSTSRSPSGERSSLFLDDVFIRHTEKDTETVALPELLCFLGRLKERTAAGRAVSVIIPIFYRLNINDQAFEKYLSSGQKPQERMLRAMETSKLPVIFRGTFGEEEDIPAFKDTLLQPNHESRVRRFLDKAENVSSLVLDFNTKHQDAKVTTFEGTIPQALHDDSSNPSRAVEFLLFGTVGLGKSTVLNDLSSVRQNPSRAATMFHLEALNPHGQDSRKLLRHFSGLRDREFMYVPTAKAMREILRMRSGLQVCFQLHGRLKRYADRHEAIPKHVCCSQDNTIRIWDVQSGQECCDAIRGHAGSITGVAVLSGGERIVPWSLDGTVRTWDTRKLGFGKQIDLCISYRHDSYRQDRYQHDSLVTYIALTPDGSWAVSAPNDGIVRIWDMQSGGQTGSFHVMASAGFDKVIRMSDLESHKMIRCFTGHKDWITCVVMTRDGHYAVTGSSDQTVRIWDVSGSTTFQTLCCKGAEMRTDESAQVVGRLAANVVAWDVSADEITMCAGLENGQVVCLRMPA